MVVHGRLAAGHGSILVKIHIHCFPGFLRNVGEALLEKDACALHLGLSKFVKVMGSNLYA
jgi:hypothetical protein